MDKFLENFSEKINENNIIFKNVVESFHPFFIANIFEKIKHKNILILYIVRNNKKIFENIQILNFINSKLPIINYLESDFDSFKGISTGKCFVENKIKTLEKIKNLKKNPSSTIILTSAAAVLQKLIPYEELQKNILSLNVGKKYNLQFLSEHFKNIGFEKVNIIPNPGEYKISGDIIDIFPPGNQIPIRLDFFYDTLTNIIDLKNNIQKNKLVVYPISEIILNSENIKNFYLNFKKIFKKDNGKFIYDMISRKERFPGIENFLPLFYQKLENIFDYTGKVCLVSEDKLLKSFNERYSLVNLYYKYYLNHNKNPSFPFSLDPNILYISPDQFFDLQNKNGSKISLTSFSLNTENPLEEVIDLQTKESKNFSFDRHQSNNHLFKSVIEKINFLRSQNKKILISANDEDLLENLSRMFREYSDYSLVKINNLSVLQKTYNNVIFGGILSIENGFDEKKLSIITIKDILGNQYKKNKKSYHPSEIFYGKLNALNPGDLVIHINHGVGKFIGLKSVNAVGAVHDCLEIHYAENDRLFLPVENIDLLSFYGENQFSMNLDKLGGSWIVRKEKIKKKLKEIAEELILIAATRKKQKAPIINFNFPEYEKFINRFPYHETEDQRDAIKSVFEDLSSGKPMDRLICGDVGFGKTEVAIRAAFACVMSGFQVALVAPTTLLASQHYKTFIDRLRGFPIYVGCISRLIKEKNVTNVIKNVNHGTIDILIGTHAIFSNKIQFSRIGLLIVDEEQYFGVHYKEKLKQINRNIHVLTLSATPIPRTLQLSFSGVRELSLITTPPANRLSIKTYITSFESSIIIEALLREYTRGGQSFYVCPRIVDLEEIEIFLKKNLPQLKVVVAHGKMLSHQLDDVMINFYHGKYDVLLSTSIIGSGLDISTANTLIVHRSDMFGLSTLYQLRGRIGRSYQKAYAVFTISNLENLTSNAERRLKILQSLDTLGSGFQLASYDLDIRGAGNILGKEQSGHIKEIGLELYQKMLNDAIANIQKSENFDKEDINWSPQIVIDAEIIIEESYISDFTSRVNIYRRIGNIREFQEINSLIIEITEKFGELPKGFKNLLKIVHLKILCRKTNIERLDIGTKGMVVVFHNQKFLNGIGLINMIQKQGKKNAKIREDQSIIFFRDWKLEEKRFKESISILRELFDLVKNKNFY